jgi:hypothetical protein
MVGGFELHPEEALLAETLVIEGEDGKSSP